MPRPAAWVSLRRSAPETGDRPGHAVPDSHSLAVHSPVAGPGSTPANSHGPPKSSVHSRPDARLARFMVHTGRRIGPGRGAARARRADLRLAPALAAAIATFEFRLYADISSSDWFLVQVRMARIVVVNRSRSRLSSASGTAFSAHFSASHEANPQISGLRPPQITNREPSQVTYPPKSSALPSTLPSTRARQPTSSALAGGGGKHASVIKMTLILVPETTTSLDGVWNELEASGYTVTETSCSKPPRNTDGCRNFGRPGPATLTAAANTSGGGSIQFDLRGERFGQKGLRYGNHDKGLWDRLEAPANRLGTLMESSQMSETRTSRPEDQAHQEPFCPAGKQTKKSNLAGTHHEGGVVCLRGGDVCRGFDGDLGRCVLPRS